MDEDLGVLFITVEVDGFETIWELFGLVFVFLLGVTVGSTDGDFTGDETELFWGF
jgi:hypothetical protein